jgi:hypothetical protein
VGIVVTTSPSLSLYKIVVFPAASSPTIKIRISFLPNILSQRRANDNPILKGLSNQKYKVNQIYAAKSQGKILESKTSKMIPQDAI